MHEYLFHVPYDGQTITVDGKEVLEAIWVPITEAVSRFVNGVPIREHKRQMLIAIQQGNVGTKPRKLMQYSEQVAAIKQLKQTDVGDFYSAVSIQ